MCCLETRGAERQGSHFAFGIQDAVPPIWLMPGLNEFDASGFLKGALVLFGSRSFGYY